MNNFGIFTQQNGTQELKKKKFDLLIYATI